MLNEFFRGLFTSGQTNIITIGDFLLCIGFSLLLGLGIALSCRFKNHCTKSFFITLATLPAVVCVVIMMVNGNIGVGVAVAGAFSLVRFRSLPGTAREIGMLFFAMATGLMTGMGYLGFALLFTVVLCAVFMLYDLVNLDGKKGTAKTFKIVIPEDLDYTGVFEEIFQDYASSCELVSVKSINMGSLFRLSYDVVLKDPTREKELIDKLRCRNGNLEITVSRQSYVSMEL